VARKKQHPMITQIQDAIRNSGRSLNELGRVAGLDPGQLSRFLHNRRTLTLPAFAKLADVLGLRLVGPEQPARPAAEERPARRGRKPKEK
jgi:transcriptional regulator with XRE-family HTH domain